MIITRTPFRITLGGGGTDLPSFYEQHGGYVFAMTINKYMYISIHRLPVTERKSIIRYSKVETVSSLSEIAHPLAREALTLHGVNEFIELTSQADLPAKTGLGSSGAYLVGLLTAIRAYRRQTVSIQEIAEEACHIEMNILNEPVGKQDQFMAAFGGFRTLDIDCDGKVNVGHVPVDFMTATELANKARMYYTGIQRSANAVLKHQNDAAKEIKSLDHHRVVDSLLHIKDIGYDIEKAFRNRDLDRFAVLMDKHWKNKKQLSAGISISVMDELYEHVKREFGVLGGKIIGAGGGGFALFYCPSKGRELDAFMASHGMPSVPYFPSMQGARVVADLSSFDDFETQAME
ncbi:MAG: galactokinase [Spartobacteria bacterium]|nr:galactokinase [Spartobacteria bacterium]